jgi:hypothetical protein
VTQARACANANTHKRACMHADAAAQLADFAFLVPLLAVVLVARWLFLDTGGAKSASAAKIHATSNYNR